MAECSVVNFCEAPDRFSDDWIKGNLAAPGSLLKSKPTWRNSFGCSATSVFLRSRGCGKCAPIRNKQMDEVPLTMAQRLADVASAMQQQRTGDQPESASVVLGEDTLVVTLHDALTPAERALARRSAGAARVQESHRQLFASSSDAFRQEIKR